MTFIIYLLFFFSATDWCNTKKKEEKKNTRFVVFPYTTIICIPENMYRNSNNNNNNNIRRRTWNEMKENLRCGGGRGGRELDFYNRIHRSTTTLCTQGDSIIRGPTVFSEHFYFVSIITRFIWIFTMFNNPRDVPVTLIALNRSYRAYWSRSIRI